MKHTEAISKEKSRIKEARTTILAHLTSLLDVNGGEINFLEDIGESLCIDSTNGVSQCIEGIGKNEKGRIIVFGSYEDESCGASLDEFELHVEQIQTDNLVCIAEMIERASEKK